MLSVKLICVGKMKEKHFCDAFDEYSKRLGAFCRFEVDEIAEQRLPDSPSAAISAAALKREAEAIRKKLPSGAAVTAMCVEGREMSSPQLAAYIAKTASGGTSRLCFLVGGSFGLDEELKREASLRLSMSAMTFPHHLARVMLAEQLYRAFTINAGARYHK
ncbi:MAG: 23S rRNA (pseudouridine(1915)-N(3))-methyltransferase RlmH [Oscillospiraceae bacterium]|nr:23S rRNA (pseudouridine(1915)-N(3))-methyltransferase RlmH [Oscillospiraceae bacterium]